MIFSVEKYTNIKFIFVVITLIFDELSTKSSIKKLDRANKYDDHCRRFHDGHRESADGFAEITMVRWFL